MNTFHRFATTVALACTLGACNARVALTATGRAARDTPRTSRNRANPPAPAVQEVRLHAGNLAEANTFAAPSQGLVLALRQYPRATRFRVMWSLRLIQTDIDVVALYDRRRGTFSYSSSGAMFGTPVREQARFSGVTDALLRRFAARHNRATSGDESAFFKELPRFGARRERR